MSWWSARTFHSVTINNMTFEGILSADGPAISCEPGGVALVVCAIRKFEHDPTEWHGRTQAGWWIVKYVSERRIFLDGFSALQLSELATEFGILMEEKAHSHKVMLPYRLFLHSPAWRSLVRWTAAHPRISKSYSDCDPYLRGWYDLARSEGKALNAT